jgi:hypothetical protein
VAADRVDPKMYVVELLTEVKLAEKRVAKVREKLEPLAGRIKQALTAGDRPTAEKLALSYEQAKDELARAERELEAAKAAHEQGKKAAAGASANLRSARTNAALADALGKVNGSLDTAKAGEDALRALEEESAISDARLDMALEEADRLGGPDLGPKRPAAAPPPLPSTAEDILKEFEK